jgi:hypothetical protein
MPFGGSRKVKLKLHQFILARKTMQNWRPHYFLHEQKWWSLLKPKDGSGQSETLLSRHHGDIDPMQGSLVICWNPGRPDLPKRLFTYFKSYLAFAAFQRKFFPHQTERNFFEVILGDSAQKPHFDLEQEAPFPTDSLEDIWTCLLTTIIQVMQEKGVALITERDILNFSSHGPDKRSYHVVIDNYCHSNHKEAKAFYDVVVAKLPKAYWPYVDKAVYSSKQQFRIVGSQKVKSGRIKTLISPWPLFSPKEAKMAPILVKYMYLELPESPDMEELLQFEASLVGCTHNCVMLPSFLNKEETTKSLSWDQEREPISDVVAKLAIDQLAMTANLTLAQLPYKMIGIKGGLVMLKRLKPSTCRICKRVHELENPFLIVVKRSVGYQVYFHCRRASNEAKLDLGMINSPLALESIGSEVETKDGFSKTQWAKNVLERLNKLQPVPAKPVENVTSIGGALRYNPVVETEPKRPIGLTNYRHMT